VIISWEFCYIYRSCRPLGRTVQNEGERGEYKYTSAALLLNFTSLIQSKKYKDIRESQTQELKISGNNFTSKLSHVLDLYIDNSYTFNLVALT
jgi:hypothetical protein